jgi:hypothetical protein
MILKGVDTGSGKGWGIEPQRREERQVLLGGEWRVGGGSVMKSGVVMGWFWVEGGVWC